MGNCSVPGCNRPQWAKGLCNKHCHQLYKHGQIQKRTIADPNEFIIDGDICWIILYNKQCIEVARAKIDTKYYKIIEKSKLKWCNIFGGYVMASWHDNGKQQRISLHDAIIQLSGQEVPDGYEIDHKDRNPLNCLEENLRVCVHLQNSHNKTKNTNNTSGYKGVSWDKTKQKWQAQITINYKHIRLGNFDTPIDAAKAYNIAAIKYHGEFAVLNNV